MPCCMRLLVTLPVMAAVCCEATQVQSADIVTTPGKPDTRMVVSKDNHPSVIDVHCPLGIDRAALNRAGAHWPTAIVLRLHIKGLESFEATSGQATLLVAVPSTGEPLPRLSLKQDGKETAIDKQSPYWADVKVVGPKVAIPLENGHFEIPLPAKLFEGNPETIQLRWVDFYRN